MENGGTNLENGVAKPMSGSNNQVSTTYTKGT